MWRGLLLLLLELLVDLPLLLLQVGELLLFEQELMVLLLEVGELLLDVLLLLPREPELGLHRV